MGPMFPTTTKHKPALAGPAYLSAYLSNEATARVPHLAIGGITPENVGELVAAGCRGVAVSSAVCGADNPGAVCRAILNALTQAPNQHRSPAGRLAARGAARG
ncbi:MAG: thiamine phosphate synthase [Phycisphaerales bacterium]|nr:thiamine phosphate synthase [Phycisphaerales bacterium]